ncbi:circumsporozoite protein- membrane associated protein, partial [Rhodopirellula maiorica SM1]
MSQPTTASQAPPPAANRDQNAFQNVASLIESRIREAQNALWWSEFVRSILRIFIGVFVAVLLWVVLDQWIYTPGMIARLAGFVVLLGWVVHQAVTRVFPVLKGTIRPEYAARSLERDVPEMRQELTSYVTLREQSSSPSLSGKVIRSIGAHAASRLRTHDALPAEATGTLRWWIAAASLMAIFFIYAALSPKNSFQSASRLVMPIASIDPAKRVKILDVT